jgi:hypothetical protein
MCSSILLIAAWLWSISAATLSKKADGEAAPMHNMHLWTAQTDAESLLARGELLPLACVGIAELELLRGISDTTAGNLLAARATLLDSRLPAEQALEGVRGIGITKARQFAHFLSLSKDCLAPFPILFPIK